MNIEKDKLLELFKEKVTDSIYPLKMGGHIDEKAFNELLLVAEEATKLLKNDDLIPKKLLLEIYVASGAIAGDNEYFKSKFLSEISARLLNCFNLIIDGRTVEDQRCHGPRII